MEADSSADALSSASSVAVVSSQRVVALERLGRKAEAEAELRWLIEDSIVPVDFLRAMFDGSKIYPPCLEVWARLEASTPAPAPEVESAFLESEPAQPERVDAEPARSSSGPMLLFVAVALAAAGAAALFVL